MNGTLAAPAASMVATLLRGSLSGQLKWGIPGSMRRGDMFSSMRPIEGLEGRSARMVASSIRPGLAWGNSDVSAATASDIART